MVADKIVSQFFEMEKNYHLFDLKTDDEIPIWDILRYDVYSRYLVDEGNGILKKKNFSVGKTLYAIIRLFPSLFSFFLRKSENIIFPTSRYRNNEGYFFDKSSKNIIDFLSENILIVERFKIYNKYAYPIEYNFISLFKAIYRKKYVLLNDIMEKIEIALTNTFGEKKLTRVELNKIITNFYKEYIYYKFYYKLKKPKRIFFTQNGIQKGMIYAAHLLGIKIFEIQHGSFGYDHLAYSYSSITNNTIIPDMLLSMGNLWGKNIYTPIKIVTIGNDYFAYKKDNEVSDKSILFISSNIHGEKLSELAVKIAANKPDLLIKFKLHPNEYSNKEYYRELFLQVPNILILQNEVDINTLIAKAELVVIINSTVLYEAINQGTKVAIFKVMNYESQSECFDLPNVYLFDNVEELGSIYKAEKTTSNITFFEKFNKEKFESLLEN